MNKLEKNKVPSLPFSVSSAQDVYNLIMTPDYARGLLEQSAGKNFRRLRTSHAANLRRMMLAGEWKPGVSHIIIDTDDGTLIDGQHRMAALAGIDTPGFRLGVRAVFARRKDVELHIDQFHIARSIGDHITHHCGIRAGKTIAAGIKIYLMWGRGGRTQASLGNQGPGTSDSVAHPTPEETTEVAVKHNSLLDALLSATGTYNPLYLTSHMIFLGLHVVTRGDVPLDYPLAYIVGMRDGANLDASDPRVLFRNFMAARIAEGGKRNRFEILARTLHTWNNYISGVSLKKHQLPRDYNQTGVMPEIETTVGRSTP